MDQDELSKNSWAQWKYLFRLVREMKIPWYLFTLSVVMDALSATMFVKLPVMLGAIMKGAIFSKGPITHYAMLSSAQVGFGFLTMFVFNWVSVKANVASGVGIWNRIIQLPMRALMREKPSTLISRVTSDSDGVGLALSGMFNCLSVIYTLVVVYVEMFKINTTISLMLLIIPVWMLISMKIIGTMSYRAQRKIQDTLSAFTAYLSIRLPNMRQIKAFGTEEKERKMGGERVETQYGAEITMVKVSAVATALQNMSTTLCNLIVLAFGSYMTASGKLTVGDLVTYFLFISQGSFTNPAQNLLLYYQNMKVGLGVCSKVMELMDEEPELVTREKSFTVPEADIHFENVSFGYGDKQVLENVTFTIPSKKTTAIIGTNGSGKTTVLKLLERFFTPDSGKITYGEEDIERYHLNEWRESIGYVVQNSPMLQGTIEQNITYGMDDPDEESAVQAAKEVDAYPFISKMPEGFHSDVGELGCKLSGGQRQKLAIARALIGHPEMVLLDEATCGLDACSEQEIRRTLRHTLKGKTVVMVAHSPVAVRHADNIIVLRDGRLADMGTHESLLKSSDFYRKFCAAGEENCVCG